MFDNPYLHLGLGILGANTGGANFAQALGRGGLLGMQSYQSGQQHAANLAKAKQTAALQAQQLETAKRANEQAALRVQNRPQVQALMGQPAQMMGPPTAQGQMELQPGSGVLGGMSPQEYNAKLSGIGGYEKEGMEGMAKLMQQTAPQASALERQVQAMGLQPGTPEYQQAMKQAVMKPPSSVSVQNAINAADPATAEMNKGIAKNLESRISGYRTRASDATDFQNSLNRFSMEMDRAGKTGGFQDTKRVLMKYAGKFGFPINEAALSSLTAVDQASKMMVASELRKNAGSQTDFDAQFTSEYLPSLGTPTEANKAAVNFSSSINRMSQIYGAMANQAYDIEGDQSNFRGVQAAMKEVDNIAMTTPAVVKLPDSEGGAWITFEEFYKDKQRKGMKPRSILLLWREEAGNLVQQ